MNEFQEKVDEFKQTFQDHGFSPALDGEFQDDNAPSDHQEVDDQQKQETHHRKKSEYRSRKKADSLKQRLDAINYEKNIIDAQNKDLLARLREKESILAEKQFQLEQQEQHKNAYYENNLGVREEAILNELKLAKEEGDVEKEVSLERALAQVTADRSTYDYHKSQERQKQPQQNDYNDISYEPADYYPEMPHMPYVEEPENEALEYWMEANPWADPQSSHFDPHLRNEVNELSSKYDKMLRYNGHADMIGTPQYFNSLTKIMNEQYGVEGDSDQDDRQDQSYYQEQAPSSRQFVAPVSRSGSSMADQYMSRNQNNTRQSISLTPEQLKVAENLQIRLPNGSMASREECIRRYAHELKRSPQSGHKITID